MRVILAMAALAMASAVQASEEFQVTFGGPDFDRGIFVTPTEDGGFVAVGVTKSEGAGLEDVYLVKTDETGKLLWSRTYGGLGAEFGWTVLEVAGGYAIAGFTDSFGEGENDFYLVRTDRAGEELWSRTYGGAGNDRCWSMIPVADGGFLLAGETTSTGSGEQDCWLVRIDDEGEELWSRAHGGEKGDRVFSIVSGEEGGFVLAGQTFSEGAGDRDAWVVGTDALGLVRWSRTFGGAESDVAHGVTRTRDGAFLVTGYTTSFAEGGDDPYLVKITAEGDSLWTRVLSLDGNNHTITGEEAEGGGFYLAGFSEFRGRGPTAALLVRTDAEGNLDWHRNIQASQVGESFGYTLKATSDGGCVFAGHTSVEHPQNLDLLLVKVEGDEP